MGFEEPYSRKNASKIGRNFVFEFLILLLICVIGIYIMQVLTYRFAKKNIHKYKEMKWIYMWLDMTMKKGPRLDLFDFVLIVIVSIIWKIWMLPLV
ncbi:MULTISPECIES: hypothetical protein [Bacillus]|jgi:hypothetical protein|uniref:Group-specific protein n=6 Tax=Bacillus cereus group TaxID=86661 RepID=A0A7T3VIP8_BACMY|nr:MULTISPECIES: hypothetical protein [Bacillus]MBK5514852.1 hypothetical protein [Bacillus sp. TH11]KMQ17426.1 Heme/copper-type cytochrome/quinol oxidase subunit 4 [Bacillus mycoides]MBG9723151.1 Heme/copper-type cytochrome/quinol oxidase subunit 4 [Bacillus mycoides]MBJ8017198.1 hypothetical protein [Bacillus cereus group sp. N34]MBK5427568.1 hypothetical protein [Bacillus sp. TH30]